MLFAVLGATIQAIKLLESVQRRATKTMKGPKGKLRDREQLRSLGLLSLEKMRLKGDLTAVTTSL